MTLEEAIAHAIEKSKTIACTECAAEHRQLANWLLELQSRRSDQPKQHGYWIVSKERKTAQCSVCKCYQPVEIWDYHKYCPFCGAKMDRAS